MFLLIFILMLATQHALGVEVIEGAESVVLPCEAPPGKASSVVWSRYELNPPTVHVRIKTDQPEKDDLTNQNQLFTNRTEVQPDALTTGHVSLTLKHIQLKDRGTYSCTARGRGERLTETQVELQVTSIADDQARRLLITLIAVGTSILCIVAAGLGWLYYSGYIGTKVQQVVDSGVKSVLLRCRTIRLLPKDVRVKWTAGDRMVHESLIGSDQSGEQDEDYKGRTEMKRNLRILVDLSLTLKHPTDIDSKTYTCTVYSREGDILMRREVKLEVKVPKVEVDSEEKSVLLPCETRVQLPEDVRVQWTDGGRKVHVSLKGSDQPGEQDNLYRGRTEMKRERPGDLSLTLKHPTETDRNLYTCTVYSREGDVLMKRQVELWVKRLSDQQVVVDSGVKSVLLPCETTVQLPEDVRVQWTDGDNKKLHVSLNGSDQPGEQDAVYRGRTEMKRDLRILVDLSLTLKHPTVRDRDTYTCTVYSREGDVLVRRHVKLWVKVQQVVVDSGEESVLLRCEATGQLPEDVRVQWTDGDKKKLHVSLKGSDQPGEQDDLYGGRTQMKRERPGDLSLTLKRPTGRDSKLYTCTVYSREGDVLMVRQVQLEVKVQQVVEVDSGKQSVLLPCEATGQQHEDVRVQWTDGDNMIVHVSLKGSDRPGEQDNLYRGRTEMKRDQQKPGDLSLTLKHPTERDSKVYTCTVYSREGDVLMERQVRLWVREQGVVVDQGAESVELPFKTTELPEDVRVTWRRRDPMETVHVFQDGSDQQDPSYRGRTERKGDLRQGDLSLILKHPTGRDEGRYICSVYSREEDIMRETTFCLGVKVCPVEVKQGAESVLLPFKTTDLPEDVRVTWRRLDPMKMVHVFQDGSDQQDQQDPSYRGRTEMKRDLRQGDVSLILKHPIGNDRGRYICRVYSKEGDIRRETTFHLYIRDCQVKEEEPVLQPEVPELKSTHEGYQLVNMDPAESC